MTEEARNGKTYAGLKLKPGRKYRKFKDETTALRELSVMYGFETVAKYSLKTLKDLDYALGSDALEPYIERAQYAAQLVVDDVKVK